MQIKIGSKSFILNVIVLNVIVVSAITLLVQTPVKAQGGAALRQVAKQQRQLEAQERRQVALEQKQVAQARKQELQQQRAVAEKEKVVRHRAIAQPASTANPALEGVYSQALSSLEAARNDLLNGNHDYHGFRVEALARANDTIGQIEAAMKYYQVGTKAGAVSAATANATRLNAAIARAGGAGSSLSASRSVGTSPLPGGVAVKGVSELQGEAVAGKGSLEPMSRLVGAGKGVPGIEVDDPSRDHYMPDALASLRQAQAALQGAGADPRGIHARAVIQLNDAAEMVIKGIEWQAVHRKLITTAGKKRP